MPFRGLQGHLTLTKAIKKGPGCMSSARPDLNKFYDKTMIELTRK